MSEEPKEERDENGYLICRSCKKSDDKVKIQFDGGLSCGPHHSECFNEMVRSCRSRSW